MEYQHILIDGFSTSKEYKGKGFSNERRFFRDKSQRQSHGVALLNVFDGYPLIITGVIEDEPSGIFVSFDSEVNYEISIESLDTKDFKLCNVKVHNGIQTATVFIPENKRITFRNKLQAYSKQEKSICNNKLFDNIRNIRLADISSFFTSHDSLYPAEDEEIWWEVWLGVRSFERKEVDSFLHFCSNNGISVGTSKLFFERASVVVVKASIKILQESIILISCLQELRRVVDTPHFLLSQNNQEQAEWARSILSRLDINNGDGTSAVILDSGVNINHPLIAPTTYPELHHSWGKDWPKYDKTNDHGSLQAGLVIYGDISEAILTDEPINVNFTLESCRIFSPNDDIEKFLYGALTNYAVSATRNVIDNNKIYSLAVTADNDGLSGQPTSWSAEIDQLHCLKNNNLFVISAGNIRDLSVLGNYPTINREYPIEDPAQSWNALTVGAYTKKVAVREHSFNHWTPQANSGGLTPTSRTSVLWDWRKEAPFKPDVVEEGGNILISPDGTEFTNADCVSLVTTSGFSEGEALFSDHRETSAATALITRMASKLWAENPEFWPETIRALIVHSADWTEEMKKIQHADLLKGLQPKDSKENMLRTFGHGVPNYKKALNSTSSYLTIIAQEKLRPFKVQSSDVKLNEMDLIELPWPREELLALGATEVKLRITLSYFIEPNPGRRSYKQRFRYQSHGLRFKLINSTEEIGTFIARINQSDEEDYEAADNSGWILGENLRKRGSLHQDTWLGTASDLATRNTIAVHPVAGWWKHRSERTEKALLDVRYSLVISLDIGEGNIDIYTPVANQVTVKNKVSVVNEIML
ncbi:S8 family peptidase [Yersinia enterocolitica]|uniref:S8 family peptidase n=1 Tax=Yersinia enterocolitica TaxID=630 RepID=UPI003CC4D19A